MLTRTRAERISHVDDLRVKALRNCSEDFHDICNECALTIATMMSEFTGDMLTLLVQRLEPNIVPNPNKVVPGNPEATRAMQRNYFTSAGPYYFRPLVHPPRDGKVEPVRLATHDEVLLYRSRIYGQKDVPLSHRSEAALRNILAQ